MNIMWELQQIVTIMDSYLPSLRQQVLQEWNMDSITETFLEELIKEHPQDKVYIVGYALVGAAEGGHTDLVDWILTT